ncbi:UNVERIFIED_ORG: hypothetical protein ABIB21_003483 [Arthrobacter sp. UYEF13]
MAELVQGDFERLQVLLWCFLQLIDSQQNSRSGGTSGEAQRKLFRNHDNCGFFGIKQRHPREQKYLRPAQHGCDHPDGKS